ncbi:MAG: Gfo/Idh/MocA family oxidoreductase [Candidimonas sp.]|nr:MAG: Gfo/Idh/MocA family oxidoreductase [Candidimonas sp.]
MPKSPVPVAVVGLGRWSTVLTHAALASPMLHVVAATSRSRASRDAYQREFGIPTVPTLDEILANENITGVLITVPNDAHLEIAARAAHAGKHIFVEKPIANTMADGLALAALEKTHGIVVTVGHCARLLAGVRLIKAALDRGELGKLCYLECRYLNDRALRLTPESWRWYPEKAPGGCLSQIAVHSLDILHYLGGEVREVGAISARLADTGAAVDDQSLVLLRFAGGHLGYVGSSWTVPGAFSVLAAGTEALMSYQIDQTLWSQASKLHQGAELFTQRRGDGFGKRTRLQVPPGDMFREELEVFAAAIAGEAATDLSARNGCVALAMVRAALQSTEAGGRAVALDTLLA